MLRLFLLAAVSAATILPYAEATLSLFPGYDLGPYSKSQYCAPIQLRYPDISSSACSYIVRHYVQKPPKRFISDLRLSLPHITSWTTAVPTMYWTRYLSTLVDLMPPVFYTPKPFYSSLSGYIRRIFPHIRRSTLYYDHLALTDTFLCSNLVAPVGWTQFLPFYKKYVLKLSYSPKTIRDRYVPFPSLPTIASRLESYSFSSPASYFKRSTIIPLFVGSTKLTLPKTPLYKPQSLWFPRRTLRGLHGYLTKRKFSWDGWYKAVGTIKERKTIKWGPSNSNLLCGGDFHHLRFLCPAWEHGLLPILRMRWGSYPQDIIYSQDISFSMFLRSFLYQWRPRYRVYCDKLVTSAMLSFDNYVCGWRGGKFRHHKFCRVNRPWYGGCKSRNC